MRSKFEITIIDLDTLFDDFDFVQSGDCSFTEWAIKISHAIICELESDLHLKQNRIACEIIAKKSENDHPPSFAGA